MTKICTDIYQSKKLIELGIDINTADMSYRPYEEDGISSYLVTLCPHRFASWIGIPCWSLAALLEIIFKVNEKKTFYSDENPLDEAFETVCWLLENNKI